MQIINNMIPEMEISFPDEDRLYRIYSDSKKNTYFDVVVTTPDNFLELNKIFPASFFVIIDDGKSVAGENIIAIDDCDNTIKVAKDDFSDKLPTLFVNDSLKTIRLVKKNVIADIIISILKTNNISEIIKKLKLIGLNTKVFGPNANDFDRYLKKKKYKIKGNRFVFSKNGMVGFYIDSKKIYLFKSFWHKKVELKKDFFVEFYNILKDKLSAKDVAKNIKAKKTVTKLEEKEKFLANHIGEGLFIEDRFGKIIFVNKRFRQMFPIQNGAIYNKRLKDIIKFGKDINLFEYWKSHNKKALTITIEADFLGDKQYYEIVYSPVLEGGKIVSYSGIIRDVTLQVKLEEEIGISSVKLEHINKNLMLVQQATILGFAKLTEYKDRETGGHLERIQGFVKILSEELYKQKIFVDFETKKNYLSNDYIEEIALSSLLHDIGKVGIPDVILQKPGRLSKKEFEYMQLHTKIGGDTLDWLNKMVEEKSFLSLAKEIAYYHHEKWDGSGYPFGLSRENIPLSARIVSLCDVYDALTSKRSYKEPYSHEKSCEIIYNSAGSHFDPIIVSAFSVAEEKFRILKKRIRINITKFINL